jgi:hypothetical protein
MLQLAKIIYIYIGQLNALQIFLLWEWMSLQELLMFICKFNAFKELNLLMCFKLRELLSSIANRITNKKTSFFNQPTFDFDVISNYISIVIFLIFKKIIHNCQVNWATYSFGGQMKANPNYFEIHRIFLTPTWRTIEF